MTKFEEEEKQRRIAGDITSSLFSVLKDLHNAISRMPTEHEEAEKSIHGLISSCYSLWKFVWDETMMKAVSEDAYKLLIRKLNEIGRKSAAVSSNPQELKRHSELDNRLKNLRGELGEILSGE